MLQNKIPYEEDKYDYSKVIRISVKTLFLSFIIYLTFLIQTKSLEEAMNIFKNVRNISYIVIVVFLFFVGFWIMLKRGKENSTNSLVAKLFPLGILSIILITFSFAISKFLSQVLTAIGIF